MNIIFPPSTYPLDTKDFQQCPSSSSSGFAAAASGAAGADSHVQRQAFLVGARIDRCWWDTAATCTLLVVPRAALHAPARPGRTCRDTLSPPSSPAPAIRGRYCCFDGDVRVLWTTFLYAYTAPAQRSVCLLRVAHLPVRLVLRTCRL